MKNNSIQFGIVAYRSNGERVYYCDGNGTKAASMIPYAASLACLFDTKKQAALCMKTIESAYAGLTGWTVFQNI